MIQGPSQLEWLPDISLDTALPKRAIPRSRQYSNVVFETSSLLIVAASSLEAQFTSYDEDNNVIWEPDGAYRTPPLLRPPLMFCISRCRDFFTLL